MGPTTKLDAKTRLLIVCGIAAPVVALSTFAVAAARLPGYDHVADTISKLSAPGVPGRWLWTIGLTGYAVLVGLFAAGLRRRFGDSRPMRTLWGAILAHAFLMAGVALFRDDLQRGGFFTLEGALHDVLSGMAFSALVVAMWGTIALARIDPTLRSLRTLTSVVGVTMTSIGIGFVFTPPEVQGVPQRAFVVLAAIWIVVVAVYSMRSPRTKRAGR